MSKRKLPLSPVGRVSFHSVFQPTAMEEGQEKKYGISLLFPKKLTGDQLALFKAMKDEANRVCKEKFDCELGGKYKGKPIRSPFRDGAEKDHLDGYDESIFFLRFSGRAKPHVVGPDKSPITDEFYNGCYARVSYTVYAYTKGTPGVAFGLVNVQKTADGDSFGLGRSDPDDDFDTVDSGDDSYDSAEDDIESVIG